MAEIWNPQRQAEMERLAVFRKLLAIARMCRDLGKASDRFTELVELRQDTGLSIAVLDEVEAELKEFRDRICAIVDKFEEVKS